jgi:hypothetical protein
MRKTSNCQNSSSVDSYNNDASLASTNPSIITEQTINTKSSQYINSFHTPKFFKSIPKTGSIYSFSFREITNILFFRWIRYNYLTTTQFLVKLKYSLINIFQIDYSSSQYKTIRFLFPYE